MKLTTKRLRQLIKEELNEIYGKGAGDLGTVPNVPLSKGWNWGSGDSFQPRDIHEVLKLLCPSGSQWLNINRQGIEMYNIFRDTNLDIWSADWQSIFIEGEKDELEKFIQDFKPFHDGGAIVYLELREFTYVTGKEGKFFVELSCDKRTQDLVSKL